MAEIALVSGDITRLSVDAIVNAANPGLLGGGGVDGAIHRAAGPGLLKECQRIAAARKGLPGGACPPGEAVITGAYRLPCKRVIHTAGPVWEGGGAGEAALLASCYRKSLLLAAGENLESAAFPNISTGVYGYPRKEAARIALAAVQEALQETGGIKKVLFVCFDEENYRIYRELLKHLPRSCP
jgi:O-acetyl-ADP-ribose deacetylase (regulator of RNase III)